MQSCSKVFTMCLVMQESGDQVIFDKVNVEPTGEAFNSIRAIEEGDGRADNPFVNPGAIATVSLVKAKNAQERWDKIIDCYNKFAGEKLTVLEDIYKSEAETNFRNRGIAHVLFNSGHLYCRTARRHRRLHEAMFGGRDLQATRRHGRHARQSRRQPGDEGALPRREVCARRCFR